MKFFDYIKMAFKNIWRRKLRSFLTVISIVIGSLAVISVLSLVFGAEATFKKQMESIGQFTLVHVTSDQQGGGGGPFGGQEVKSEKDKKKLDDTIMKQIREIPHVVDASASVQIWNIESISRKDGNGKQYRTEMVAEEINQASEKKILAGRALTSEDGKGKIVIGAHLVGSLGFSSNEDAIGKILTLTTQKGYQGDGADIPDPKNGKDDWEKMKDKSTTLEAEIVGVTAPPAIGSNGGTFITMKWGRLIESWSNWQEDPVKTEAWKKAQEQRQQKEQANKFDKKTNVDYKNNSGGDMMQECPDCMVLTYKSMIDEKGYQSASVKVDNRENTKSVADLITKLGVGAMTADDILKEISKIVKSIGAIIGAIGAISLGVAAIGIVNTMIMAMYERTREIGIMRACGAKRRTIRRLFTFEASVIGFLGGAIGIVSGIVLSKVANYFINKFLIAQSVSATDVISLPPWLILATLILTTFLGLISGAYPAYRASKVDPVEALRFE